MPRRSAIYDLPPDIKAALDKRLVTAGFQRYEELADWLGEMGYAVSKSAVHRYGQGFGEQLETLRLVTEQAKAVVDAAPDAEGAVNDALMRLTQEKLFLILRNFDPGAVKKANITFIAKAVADLAKASVAQKAWADKLRQRTEAAADKAVSVARKGGLSDAAVEMIRREILGVAT
jgi:Bacteriophage Mu, Gp27